MTEGPHDPLGYQGTAPHAGESPIQEPAGEQSVQPAAVHQQADQPDADQPDAAEAVRPALERLAELDALPTHEHVDVYDDVHRRLHEALSDLDAARG